MPKGFPLPAVAPLCKTRPAPVSTLRATASPPSVLLYRIKLPCRRIHLAFYELICLAATVTSRKKQILSSFAKYIHHPLIQPELTRASHMLNFHSSFVFVSFLFSFNFSFSFLEVDKKLPSYQKFWYEKSLVL